MRKLVMLIAVTVAALTLNAQKPRYELLWKDSFRGKELSDRWSKIPRGTSDWNNYMSSCDDCYKIGGGKLSLIGIVNDCLPSDSAPYLTGGVYTKGKATITYGKVEGKARLEGAQGAWPAIWMLPEGKGWPDGGEIDIMERLSHEKCVYQTVHSHYTYTLKKKHPQQSCKVAANPEKYNVYAVEILPDSILFSINGRHTFTYPRVEAEQANTQYPFGSPFYLLIDMQVGGKWVGKPVPDELPARMVVDWVKFYRLKE